MKLGLEKSAYRKPRKALIMRGWNDHAQIHPLILGISAQPIQTRAFVYTRPLFSRLVHPHWGSFHSLSPSTLGLFSVAICKPHPYYHISQLHTICTGELLNCLSYESVAVGSQYFTIAKGYESGRDGRRRDGGRVG